MRFAFAIPTYNYAEHIGNAIDSILKQSGDDYEIIIVDDGSTDDTKDIIAPYLVKHHNLHYFYQENQGPAAARNNAIQHASADFIFMLDADDRLLPNTLAIMRKAIDDNPKAELIIGDHYTLYPHGKRKLKTNPDLSRDKRINFIRYFRKEISIVNGGYILKREIFNKLKFPEHIHGREDIVFFAQALALAKAKVIHEPIIEIVKHHYSLRHQTDTHRGNEHIVDTLFDPAILPDDFMLYKKEFSSRLCLSFFRDNYVAGHYKRAKHWYCQAIKEHPSRLLDFKYLRKFLRIAFK